MKPCIIYVDNDAVYGEEVVLPKKDFERLIQYAYEEGRRDGQSNTPTWPINYPINIQEPIIYPTITWDVSTTGVDPTIKFYCTDSTSTTATINGGIK